MFSTQKLFVRLILITGILSLLAGLWAGLEKLEWIVSADFSSFPSHHGPFMVSGFLGTVISLERAAALGAGWAFLGPILSGAGSLLLAFGLPPSICIALISASSILFSLASILLLRRQAALPNIFLASAALLWLAGNLFWFLHGWSYVVIALWIGFLLFTIVAERLEIARFAVGGSKELTGFIYGALSIYVVAAGSANLSSLAIRIMGLCLAGIALWLLRYDIARRNITQPELPGFIARSLLLGYLWLLVSGLWLAFLPSNESGFHYDASLHAFFLGFVMSMIFAHAPIIFPSVAGLDIPFSKRFYAHLALLHLGLILRVGGDALGSNSFRKWGGLLNAVTILLFVLNTALSAIRGPQRKNNPFH